MAARALVLQTACQQQLALTEKLYRSGAKKQGSPHVDLSGILVALDRTVGGL